MKATRVCSIDGCQKPALARGWCSAHWTRWKRHGDPLGGGPARNPMPEACTIDGCKNPPFGRGLCATHWRQDMAQADPERYEAYRARRREWHAANPDLMAAARRRSRARHRDAINARTAKWREENPDLVLLNNWVSRRRSYGLPDVPVEIVHPDVVFKRDRGICQLCFEPVDPSIAAPDPMAANVDHIVPVVDPACEHSYANTQLTHADCNRRKHTSKPQETPPA